MVKQTGISRVPKYLPHPQYAHVATVYGSDHEMLAWCTREFGEPARMPFDPYLGHSRNTPESTWTYFNFKNQLVVAFEDVSHMYLTKMHWPNAIGNLAWPHAFAIHSRMNDVLDWLTTYYPKGQALPLAPHSYQGPTTLPENAWVEFRPNYAREQGHIAFHEQRLCAEFRIKFCGHYTDYHV